MKEKIDAFSKGIFRSGRRDVNFTPKEIVIEANEGSVYEGVLDFAASIEEDIEVCLVCEEPHFTLCSATQSKGAGSIKYSFDATYKNAGYSRKSAVHFISSVGEFEIPVTINVTNAVIDSSIGEISDLFQFAALAKSDPIEALEIFLGDSFERTFLKGNMEDILVYRGLKGSAVPERALEEFLLFERKIYV